MESTSEYKVSDWMKYCYVIRIEMLKRNMDITYIDKLLDNMWHVTGKEKEWSRGEETVSKYCAKMKYLIGSITIEQNNAKLAMEIQ